MQPLYPIRPILHILLQFLLAWTSRFLIYCCRHSSFTSVRVDSQFPYSVPLTLMSQLFASTSQPSSMMLCTTLFLSIAFGQAPAAIQDSGRQRAPVRIFSQWAAEVVNPPRRFSEQQVLWTSL